jgi:hypothetical protein
LVQLVTISSSASLNAIAWRSLANSEGGNAAQNTVPARSTKPRAFMRSLRFWARQGSLVVCDLRLPDAPVAIEPRHAVRRLAPHR